VLNCELGVAAAADAVSAITKTKSTPAMRRSARRDGVLLPDIPPWLRDSTVYSSARQWRSGARVEAGGRGNHEQLARSTRTFAELTFLSLCLDPAHVYQPTLRLTEDEEIALRERAASEGISIRSLPTPEASR
jgi:hypothetical protein